MSKSLLPTHDKSIDAPTLTQCGPGGQLQLEVSLDPERVDLHGVDLNGKVFEYGFTDDEDLLLHFVAAPRTPTLDGYATAIDSEGRPLGEAVPLQREGTDLVYACPRPATDADAWILIVLGEASTTTAIRAGKRDKKPRPHHSPLHPEHPHEILPTEAQPTLIVKPKRTCPPVLGKSGPPTGDK